MKTCRIQGCNGKYHARGYCIKHYTQLNRHGRIFKRTMQDPNTFQFIGNSIQISLYDRKGSFKAVTIIDSDDFDKVKNRKWRCRSDNYVISGFGDDIVFLHRLIMAQDLKMGVEVDHKNRNKLDNRKSNLRICTRSQNCQNSKKRINNTSGFKGVCWDGRTKKWMARLGLNKQIKWLGRFSDKEDAWLAYSKAAKKYFGEFARLE